MKKLALAIYIASEEFKDTLDKSGQPYILHCLRVMNSVNQKDPELMQIAVLHDLIEDTNYEIVDLGTLGFSHRVLCALSLLTHDKKVSSYEDYIKALVHNTEIVAKSGGDYDIDKKMLLKLN